MNLKSPHAKSTQSAVNTLAQTVPATTTYLQFLGSLVTDTGVSLSTKPASISIEHSGSYVFDAAVTFSATAEGTVTLRFYKDGVQIPTSVRTYTLRATTPTTLETSSYPIYVGGCCCQSASNPAITLGITGAAGTVSYVAVSGVKLA